ncbi:penicillin-binding transpeptidase domain-containing protein [uncultured Clostridium sp.]|uniref:penicillin-binding transpeptidase domain-containing protein n=1 Tax=uncultured Clostridium sp. TaxID=59620 RepID=UPI0025ED2D00|nr:penicillin-binding transpeptidase domain-containing protein [uncultured Clostridium sp.]
MDRKKNIFVIIGAGIVIVPLIICAILYIVYNRTHTSEKKWNEYVVLLQNKEYDKMYDLLDSTAQAKISREDFTARNKNIYEGIEAEDIEISINSVSKSDNDTIIDYHTKMNTIAGELQFDNSVKIADELGKGRTIKWSSKNIFPGLGETDKVRVKTLKGRRGNITDRNGELLATDSYLSAVGIVPGKLGENKDANINKIAKILQCSAESINKSLNADYVTDDMFIPVKDIPYGDARVVELLKIPGVIIKEKESRVYPLGSETAHITGYVHSISAEELEENSDKEYTADSLIGKSGLEKMYEDSIRGIDGAEIYIQNSEGEKKSVVLSRDAKNGDDLKLTIDMNIQKKLNEELGSDKGCGVVMNPVNGEVLALASTPSYNPNEFILGMTDEQWNNLNNNENKPLYNRFQATLVPGSSLKPIIAAIGVDTGIINPQQVRKIDGLTWQKDSSFGNYYVTRTSSVGEVNLENALVYSDNIYFAQIATEIGSSVLEEKLKSFGFSEKIPFEFALYNSQYSNNDSIKDGVQLADTGYGQGEVMVNPVHLTSMYTMFLNDGNIIAPHLLMNFNEENSIWKKNAISKESADEILKDLIQIVENPSGTGHQAYTEGLKIGGKTGTAEIKNSQDDTNGTELGWFVGMTTENENKLLVTMMIEDVKDRGGSHYVVPKVKQIIDNYYNN